LRTSTSVTRRTRAISVMRRRQEQRKDKVGLPFQLPARRRLCASAV
jgi:hypothetical protein